MELNAVFSNPPRPVLLLSPYPPRRTRFRRRSRHFPTTTRCAFQPPSTTTGERLPTTTTPYYHDAPDRVNEALYAKASEHGEDTDEAKPFLYLLLGASGVLFAGSLCSIGAMFHYFKGCPANELVMSLTLILAVVSELKRGGR